jgi:hypothetical protein
LFQPRDVRVAAVRSDGKLVSVCRMCRKETRDHYAIRSSNPGSWHKSMKAIFARSVA